VPAAERYAFFSGISGSTKDELWVVGSSGSTIPEQDSIAEHWDGHRWRVVPVPTLRQYAPGYGGGDGLADVVDPSGADAWAVGATDDFTHPRIVHWDGKSWKVVPSPRFSGWLRAVTATRGSLWAVGGNGQALGTLNTIRGLIEQYSCK